MKRKTKEELSREPLLERLSLPGDLKKLTRRELVRLAHEIREFILQKTAAHGGHLASNLGVVELTIALFRVFDLTNDRVIWDVGHQSYTHKILSGRKDEFDTLRQKGGLSGFPKRDESVFDAFDTGHSSTSIAAGVGMVQARDLLGQKHRVISVIGDGALTGGMAYEALNNAAALKSNFIIVLNDNHMSIAENVGGISDYLNAIRTGEGYLRFKKNLEAGLRTVPVVGEDLVNRLKRTKDGIKRIFIPGALFEDMGLTYLGPVNGHDVRSVERALRSAEKPDHAVLVHVLTRKGKGYGPAEKSPGAFHGVEPFDPKTGQKLRPTAGMSYTGVFSDALIELAERDERIVALTAAMPAGTGTDRFAQKYPDRFFDVGIAEAHAVTSAAGMAASGLIPVVSVYSSFLQRAFDQIVHDVCLQNLPVVFAVDRAGLVGADGETHQGIFDLSFLSIVPNIEVMAPKNAAELRQMLEYAVSKPGPSAIRYPRGTAFTELSEFTAPVEKGRAELLQQGSRAALFALGTMVCTAWHTAKHLEENGIVPTVVNARFAKPVDFEMLDRLCAEHELLVTMEENVGRGGMGQTAECYVHEHYPKVKVLGIHLPDAYIEHGDVTALKEMLGMDSASIAVRIRNELNNE